jgi:excisionase family DNA binding protein
MKPFNLVPSDTDRFLVSVKEASSFLGIPVFTLYSWALSRRIPHYKIGRRVMFNVNDLQVWADSHRVGEAS